MPPECAALILLIDRVNRTDIRVAQGRGGAGLASKPFKDLRVLRQMVRKKLQSNEPVEVEVLRPVDHAHPPNSESFQNEIVGDGLPGNRIRLTHTRG